MRVAYLDEAGISQSGNEPILVVAAALVNPDRHWHDIVNYYDNLAQTLFSRDEYDPEINGHFVFHAMDVWHGSGLFPRKRFSLSERMQIFQQLAQAPDLLAIPVCYGAIDKTKIDYPEGCRTELQIRLNHSLAFSHALQEIDNWMEEHCRNQVVMVTAEDTDLVRGALQLFQSSAQTNGEGYAHENTEVFMSRSIIDAINFSPKFLSPAMQMADHCAFILRRATTSCQHIQKYLNFIEPSLYRAINSRRSAYVSMPYQVRLDPFSARGSSFLSK